jgi:hypothetical protein
MDQCKTVFSVVICVVIESLINSDRVLAVLIISDAVPEKTMRHIHQMMDEQCFKSRVL